MAAKFGTSGLRGLVGELTDGTAYRHARAFASHLKACGVVRSGDAVFVGQDLRASSPLIAGHCMAALADESLTPVDCGQVATPALAYGAITRGIACLMVTGSHIPDDRNGVKFYRPDGEIDKHDEAAISARATAFASDMVSAGTDAKLNPAPDIHAEFARRYEGFLTPRALEGLRIGVYEHSAVARDLVCDLLAETGASVIRLGRSHRFVPVDTESISETTQDIIAQWTRAHDLWALVSTDGDSDRPLVADETGACLRGDALGLITALHLKADAVATPVTSNSGIESHLEGRVLRTRVGSPHVIAAMTAAAAQGFGRVLGFEANGGVMTVSAFRAGSAELSPLPTRDCILPILSVLAAAIAAGKPLSRLVASLGLPAAISGRIENFPTETGRALVASLSEDASKRARFFAPFGGAARTDLTDGLRVTLTDGSILHLRPSGNAPEMRVYAEARTVGVAQALVETCMGRVRELSGASGG